MAKIGSIADLRAQADNFLRLHWLELRNDASSPVLDLSIGAIEVLTFIGVFDDEHAELWRHRLNTCPGHYDEGGRDWCAFCGQMPPEPRPES